VELQVPTCVHSDVAESIPVRFGENSLARILKRVALHALGIITGSDVDSNHSLMVHLVMIESREKAFAEQVDFSMAVTRSREAISKHLNPDFA